MSNPIPTETKYDSKIDFVRFLAFFLVFFTHFINEGGNAIKIDRNQWWSNTVIQSLADFGGQGVPIFFALTGFLLGRILIKEQYENGEISVKSFLLRRVLRIWPLYFLFLLICIFANQFASETPAVNGSEIPFYLTFTYNWGQIFAGIPGSMATITWSISVEEQIYLLLPILLIITKKPSFKFVAIVFVFVGSLTHIFAHFGILGSVNRHTASYLLPVGIGLFVAIYEGFFRESLMEQKLPTLFSGLFCVIYPLGFRFINVLPFNELISMTATSLFFIASLHLVDKFLQADSNIVSLFARIGRISYGCYLYHWAVWTVMVAKEISFSPVYGFSIIGVLLGFVFTILISEFSYRYFESWFLRKRKKFQRVSSPVV